MQPSRVAVYPGRVCGQQPVGSRVRRRVRGHARNLAFSLAERIAAHRIKTFDRETPGSGYGRRSAGATVKETEEMQCKRVRAESRLTRSDDGVFAEVRVQVSHLS